LRIVFSDKLQSAREMRCQVRFLGDEAYRNFATSESATLEGRKAAFLWFHEELSKAFLLAAKGQDRGLQALAQEFVEVVKWLHY
ncbi:MAG: hypothetical protein J2P36_25760, partial [Ktedonobacteraceae bacterium]|nr:hypothetical protein [Ktedonobacteraceae bacterium]